ncbi:MAG: NupC/NupG family nucleoside CNT transporter [Gammaproteobacteria bacterium]|nr:NupC/NupG family nucleoside CNT transporter [Gammaproteobacteria bacterium]MCY4338152.1 NupC/NupG family nucleoside CNT transporter [Gammaproteobacteria bacterium]
MTILMSFVGMVVIICLALLLSENRRAIRLQTVVPAFLTQAAIAGLILYFPLGQAFLNTMVAGVQNVIDYGRVGSEFVFGDLAKQDGGFSIAFHLLPVIIFFSALMSTLYYLGIMQKLVTLLGGGIHRLLGTSKTESMCAVANIFIGHSESPLVIRPYLKNLTRSELFAVMTGGMAAISGAIMAAYAAMGINLGYLIAASFMAAPGGLLMAKLIKPETERAEQDIAHVQFSGPAKVVNIFEAIGNGTLDGLKLAVNVGAMLIAFVAMIALLNGLLGGLGGWFGIEELTLQGMLGKALAPLAFLLGVPWDEAHAAGSLIGQKFIMSEFIAYLNFTELRETLSPHTQVVITFALCGFANLTSIAILLGGMGSLVPERRQDIAALGFKSVLAGTLSNLMSAVLAGLFVSLQM